MEFVKLVAPVYNNEVVDVIGSTIYRAMVLLYMNYPIIVNLGLETNTLLFDFLNIMNTIINVSKTSTERGKYSAMVKGLILIVMIFILPKIVIPKILNKWFNFSGRMTKIMISTIILLVLIIISTTLNKVIIPKISEKEKKA